MQNFESQKSSKRSPRLKTCKLNLTMTLKNVSDKNIFSVMQCQETLIIMGINFLQRCVAIYDHYWLKNCT